MGVNTSNQPIKQPLASAEAANAGVQWSLASLAIADIVAAHDFTETQGRVLHLIRVMSFGARRTEAEIPELRFFKTAIDVSRGKASTVLRELKNMLVIEEEPEGFYGFRLPWNNWKVVKRMQEIEVIRQLDLFELAPNLNKSLREQFVEQTGRGVASLDRSYVMMQGGGVPFSGTPLAGESVLPKRERQELVGKTEPPRGITEKRTAAHDHDVHDPEIMTHDNSMSHDRDFSFWNGKRQYDVGEMDGRTGDEILAELLKSIGRLDDEYVGKWKRRIQFENARVVWNIAHRCRESQVRNRAKWSNAVYLDAMGIKPAQRWK